MNITEVILSTGEIVRLRVQSAFDYLDMSDALSKKLEDASRTDEIKRGISIKLSRTVCDEKGVLLPNGSTLAERISWQDLNKVIEQINENNGLGDKQVEATEKK